MDILVRRHKAFHGLLFPFSRAQRERRLRRFVEIMGIRGGERIVDLGGLAGSWAGIERPCEITVVNLPGAERHTTVPEQHRVEVVTGDACELSRFADASFDIAFSNSVIEHVGDAHRRRALAEEARRLAPRYWVQTPSIWFPVEAHTGMPFYWFYPAPAKRWLKARWSERLPRWTEMVEGTTVLSRGEMEALFPDGRIWTERLAGWPKSYVAYRA
jgi:hypothetical protein